MAGKSYSKNRLSVRAYETHDGGKSWILWDHYRERRCSKAFSVKRDAMKLARERRGAIAAQWQAAQDELIESVEAVYGRHWLGEIDEDVAVLFRGKYTYHLQENKLIQVVRFDGPDGAVYFETFVTRWGQKLAAKLKEVIA